MEQPAERPFCAQPSNCYILEKLPCELRLEIYRLAVITDKIMSLTTSRDSWGKERSPALAILSTCRQIRSEANNDVQRAVVSKNQFRCDLTELWALPKLTHTKFTKLRRLIISDCSLEDTNYLEINNHGKMSRLSHLLRALPQLESVEMDISRWANCTCGYERCYHCDIIQPTWLRPCSSLIKRCFGRVECIGMFQWRLLETTLAAKVIFVHNLLKSALDTVGAISDERMRNTDANIRFERLATVFRDSVSVEKPRWLEDYGEMFGDEFKLEYTQRWGTSFPDRPKYSQFDVSWISDWYIETYNTTWSSII